MSVKSIQVPTVGRIVHYTNLGDKDGKYPPEVIAAIITKVHGPDCVDLKIFYPTGIFDRTSVVYSDADAGSDGARGKWGWPTYVAPRMVEVDDE